MNIYIYIYIEHIYIYILHIYIVSTIGLAAECFIGQKNSLLLGIAEEFRRWSSTG